MLDAGWQKKSSQVTQEDRITLQNDLLNLNMLSKRHYNGLFEDV